jgi:hypothetical protein
MPEKDKGLKPEDHGRLNYQNESLPVFEVIRKQTVEELRSRYAGDTKAQQELNLYAWDEKYAEHIDKYKKALQEGNSAEQKKQEKWFHKHYPDVAS